MIAIADSGSTKTDWLLIQDGHLFSEVSTIGLNPVFHTPLLYCRCDPTTLTTGFRQYTY
jgi:hypothetical protein